MFLKINLSKRTKHEKQEYWYKTIRIVNYTKLTRNSEKSFKSKIFYNK